MARKNVYVTTYIDAAPDACAPDPIEPRNTNHVWDVVTATVTFIPGARGVRDDVVRYTWTWAG